jgi:hypothetical protein
VMIVIMMLMTMMIINDNNGYENYTPLKKNEPAKKAYRKITYTCSTGRIVVYKHCGVKNDYIVRISTR